MKVQKFDSINVVPFIDIMLVLLVIILTTATFIAKGIIPVELPKSISASGKLEHKDLAITISQEGAIFFEKKKICRDSVATDREEYDNNTSIRINCDKEAKFDSFIFVLDMLKQRKFKNLGIITKK